VPACYESGVIATWISVLSETGLLHGERAEAAVVLATKIVGEARMSELRAWLHGEPRERILALRAAAIELCIWMAVVDRVVDPKEREILRDAILAAELPTGEELRLDGLLASALSDSSKIAHIETLSEVLDHPVLRELMLAMTWLIATADGFVDALEVESFERLAAIFGVDGTTAERMKNVLASS
jgi:uncharacterized tellurite resistance protein B-like protein